MLHYFHMNPGFLAGLLELASPKGASVKALSLPDEGSLSL
jgi:hypothetical protein